jgi:hypothetical protein
VDLLENFDEDYEAHDEEVDGYKRLQLVSGEGGKDISSQNPSDDPRDEKP